MCVRVCVSGEAYVYIKMSLGEHIQIEHRVFPETPKASYRGYTQSFLSMLTQNQ